jgi:hypothetical protein
LEVEAENKEELLENEEKEEYSNENIEEKD